MEEHEALADALVSFAGVLGTNTEKSGAAKKLIEAAAIVRAYDRLERQFDALTEIARRALAVAENK